MYLFSTWPARRCPALFLSAFNLFSSFVIHIRFALVLAMRVTQKIGDGSPSSGVACQPVLWGVLLLILIYPIQSEAFLWEAENGTGKIYILGSIHALSPDHYPLPEKYEDAYLNAERLIFEIDMDERSVGEISALTSRLGVYKGDDSLKKTISEIASINKYEEMNRHAADAGINLALLDRLEPWMAAMTIANQALTKASLDPSLGLDQRFLLLGRKDGKKIEGLETVEEQLRLFDGMPEADQITFLSAVIAESAKGTQRIEEMVSAWVREDEDQLNKILNDAFSREPGLAERLLINRNRKWRDHILSLLDQEGDLLIIVGAGHVIGPSSLIDLLEEEGLKFTRIEPGAGLYHENAAPSGHVGD